MWAALVFATKLSRHHASELPPPVERFCVRWRHLSVVVTDTMLVWRGIELFRRWLVPFPALAFRLKRAIAPTRVDVREDGHCDVSL